MKKVLAWAVVLALVLSSFTMAFAGQAKTSKDFSDASEINYTEAVDVMVATGIINGYPDGTFGPAKTVKRSEMAKMIACIKNGGEDVGDQYKSACPFADSKDHWAAGYIAYCASEHIIDGRSADVFDPEAEVTGTEVAKMALTSLGYDSKIQGYTGENWAAAVLKDAKKNKLFDGLDSGFVPGDPCNRESAAQILFNMLKATEVEYENGTSVSIGDDISVVVDSDIKEVENDTDSDDGDGKMQMYEDVFGGKLVASDDDDASGRPAHEWSYDGDDVGTYTNDAEFEFFAEDSTSVDVALKAYDKAIYDEFVNTKPAKITKAVANGDVWINGDDNWDFDETYAVAKGDKVEFFKVDAPKGDTSGKTFYRVIVTSYVPAIITEVNTELDEDAIDEGHAALITFSIFPYGNEEGGYPIDFYDDEIPGYDESTYVEDAVIAIAYTWAGSVSGQGPEIMDSYVPEELAKGEVTKIKDDTVTVGGTACEASEVYAAVDGKAFVNEDGTLAEGEFTVYDYNGYAFASIKSVEPDAAVYYGFVTATKAAAEVPDDSGWSDGEATKEQAMVKVLTPEGKTETIALAEKIETQLPEKETLISYELNEDGEISKITPATTSLGDGTQPVKTGDVLYGKQLSGDVVAFANISTTENKPEYVVYDLDDLKAAKAVAVSAYFEETEAGIVAMKVGSLEEAIEPTVVLGFVTGFGQVTNSTGVAYEVYVNGEADPYLTIGSKDEDNAEAYAALTALYQQYQGKTFVAELAKLTLDGELVKSIAPANCYGVNAPVSDFKIEGTEYDAVFYGSGNMATAGIKTILGVSGTTLNVGSADYIDNQTVTSDADVYYVDSSDKMVASEFSKIKKGNYVILMQLDKASSTWDTVIFTDQEKYAPRPTVEPLEP